MAISTMQDDLDIIGKLGDNPNTDNNLSADQLREKFDEGPKAIKAFINTVIVPAINKLIGAVGFTGTHSELSGRDETDQHPMAAITGLVEALKGKSASDHHHDTAYAPKNHDHAGVYAEDGHNHDTTYSKTGHHHDGTYLKQTGGTMTGKITTKGIILTRGVDYGTTSERPSNPVEGQVYWRIE